MMKNNFKYKIYLVFQIFLIFAKEILNVFGKCDLLIGNELCYCSARNEKKNFICAKELDEMIELKNLSNFLIDFELTYTFFIHNKKFSKISNYAFQNLTLDIIDISRNQIFLIEPGAFLRIKKLKNLWLSKNELTNIDFDTTDLSSLIDLDLSLNKIKRLEKSFYSNLVNLNDLNLNSNEIEKLDSQIFENLKNLVYINLNRNQLKLCKRDLFKNLLNLKTIYLENNQIEFIEENCFNNENNNNSIVTISLRNNRLKIVDEFYFKNLHMLKYLYLDKNELRILSSNSFNTLSNLEYLYLLENRIIKIEYQKLSPFSFVSFIGNLSKLYRIEMNRNKIEIIRNEYFGYLPNLKFLYLEDNRIEFIEENAFDSMKNLNRLYLHRNQLNSLNISLFQNLNSLLELNINENKIKLIRYGHFRNLKVLEFLHLAKNQISSIEPGSFDSLVYLLELDLSKNCLFKLDSSLISNLKKLINLNIDSNVLSIIDERFFQNLTRLRFLKLNANKFTKFKPKTFSHLIKLEYLNLSDNNLRNIDFDLNLNHLEEIYLASNRLKSIDLYLPNLKIIDLMNNYELEFVNLNQSPISVLKIDNDKMLSNIRLDWSNLKDLSAGNISYELNFKNLTSLIYLNFVYNSIDSNNNIFILKKLEVLNLSNLWFSFNETWSKLNRLWIFDLSSNRLSTDNLILTDSISLQYLTLENCSLNNLELNFNFSIFKKLSDLNLKSNNISIIKRSYFEHNSYLTRIDFSSNYIYLIEYNSFRSVGQLSYLNLNNNRLNYFNQSMISSKNSLKIREIYLKNNHLISYSNNLLEESELDLSQNRLIDEKLLISNLKNLIYLNLNSNKLTKIKSGIFSNGLLFREIHLSSNLIETIEDNTGFLGLGLLEFIDLSKNYLRKLDDEKLFFDLKSLTRLNLSNNLVEYLSRNLFANLNRLELLDLSSNRLKSIHYSTFSKLEYLKILHLESNPLLLSIESNMTFNGLNRLEVLYLSNILITNNLENLINLKNSIKLRKFNRVIDREYFYSIFVITLPKQELSLISSYSKTECLLVLYMLRFKIHFNLGTDSDLNTFINKCSFINFF